MNRMSKKYGLPLRKQAGSRSGVATADRVESGRWQVANNELLLQCVRPIWQNGDVETAGLAEGCSLQSRSAEYRVREAASVSISRPRVKRWAARFAVA